jgi:hypothetical protein
LAISLVGTFGAGTDTGNLTATLPTGISFGDAIGAVAICSNAQTLSTPAGWSVRSGWPKDGGNARFYAYVKDAVTASDSATTVTFVPSATTKCIILGFVVRSGNGFAVDWTDQLTFLAHDTASTSYTAPASTSTTAGDWGVAVFGVRGTSPTAWTPASGLTERQDLQRAGSGAVSLQLCDSGGSVGGSGTAWGPFTESNINTSNGGALTWLVKEAPGVAVEGDVYLDAYGGGGTEPAPGSVYPKLGLWRNHDTDGDWTTRHALAEGTYGPFQGRRTQYHVPGSNPIGADVEAAIAAGKPIHIFWKPWDVSWADTVAGNYDTEIDAVAADFNAQEPTNIWLTLHHEPENDTTGATGAFSYANYRAMWSRVRTRFNAAGVTNVTWVCVFMNSHSNPSSNPTGPGQNMIDLWGNDGVMDGLVDVVSQQDYIVKDTPPAQIATKWLEDLEFLVTNTTSGRNWSYLSKPQAFTEWGADLGGTTADRGTATHRAQTIDAIRGILPELAARNVVSITYFDAGSNDISDPPSVDGVAFAALKEASEAGQQAAPAFVAGVSLARDGATTTSNTIPFTLPAGWQQGDYAVVWLSSNSLPDVTVVPTGWTLNEGPVANGSVQRGWRYSKTLQAGELNPTWTISQTVRPSGVMVLLRGADDTTPIHATGALVATASSTSHAAPAVVTTAPEAFVISVWLTRWADASGNGGVSYGTAPGTHNPVATVSPNSGAAAGAGALVAELVASPVAAGTHGPYTATFPVTSTGVCGQIAILPGTVPPPQPQVKTGSGRLDIAFTGTATGTVTTPGVPSELVPLPTVRVAWGSQPMAPVPVWTTLPGTGVGAVQAPLVITHGRPDEFSEVQPGTLSGALRNEDGRYTMGKTNGPYGTGVKIGRRVQVTLAHQGIHYTRHDGHSNGFPTTWPVGGGLVAFSELSSTDRLKRLGQIGELRSMLEEEILRDAPACYYPLSEPDGATSAGSIAVPPAAAATDWPFGLGGGSVSFGQGTGPGTDGLSAAMFGPQSQTSGRFLRANPVNVNTAASDAVTLECFFNTSAVPTPNAMAMAALTSGPGDDAVILGIWLGGQVQAFVIADGVGKFGNMSPAAYNDGHTHHAAVTLTRSAGVVTVRLYVDGVQRQTGTFLQGALGTFSQLDIGGYHVGANFAPYNGTLSHVAAHPTALSASRLATHWQAGSTGLTGERTDQRIARVADWIGLPTVDRALDVGDKTMGAQSTAGKQPLDVMREAAAVEQGVLFISPAGKLTFHRLSRRYNRTTPDLTLDCAAEGHIQVGLIMPGDDFGMVNDMEVSRPGGASQRARNQTSVDEYGLYRDSLEAPCASDNEAQAIGNWRVGNYGTPRSRIPNLTVSLSRLHTVNPSLVAAIMRLEISSLVRLTNLPTQAPGTSVDVYVEGWTETIDPAGGWAIEVNCSPADHYTVAQLGLTATVTLGTMRVGL